MRSCRSRAGGNPGGAATSARALDSLFRGNDGRPAARNSQLATRNSEPRTRHSGKSLSHHNKAFHSAVSALSAVKSVAKCIHAKEQALARLLLLTFQIIRLSAGPIVQHQYQI